MIDLNFFNTEKQRDRATENDYYFISFLCFSVPLFLCVEKIEINHCD